MLESTLLFFRDNASDKQYNASIEAVEGGFHVRFAYGRRGSTQTVGTKTSAPVDEAAARKLYAKLISEHGLVVGAWTCHESHQRWTFWRF